MLMYKDELEDKIYTIESECVKWNEVHVGVLWGEKGIKKYIPWRNVLMVSRIIE